LLRFVAVGSVDDGKSTLIGRMLYDTGMVYEDHLAQIRKASTQEGMDIDLSLLTDGLTAEREQGITIDVAYRYFTTDKRKFIIADTPGHVQYTRNMVTGASTANVAIILIDARLGVLQQSRRHAFIASLLGIPHLAVCVNKMDLVGYDRARFDEISAEFKAFTKDLAFKDVTFFPISALKGVNCVNRGEETPWYEGPTVLEFLETVPITEDRNLSHFRFPVQMVLRPNLDYRGFAGQVASGVVKPGDEIMVLPSGKKSRVKAIDVMDGTLAEAFAPQSVVLRLEDEVDVSRGDMIVHANDVPRVARSFEAHLVWLHEQPLDPGKSYLLKHTSHATRVEIESVEFRVDMDTLAEVKTETLALNDIGRVRLTTHKAIFCDPYAENRSTGSFILIDSITNNTVGAGLVASDAKPQDLAKALDEAMSGLGGPLKSQVSARERLSRFGQAGAVLALVGGDDHKRLALAYALERRLFDEGKSGSVLVEDLRGAHAVAAAGLIAIVSLAHAAPDTTSFAVGDGELDALVDGAYYALFVTS